MEIAGKGMRLRPPRASDLPALVRHAGSPAVWANLRDRFPHPYTRAAGRAWLRSLARGDDADLVLAVDVAGELVGVVGVERLGDVYRRVAEIGYWIGEAFWGRGLASQAVRLAADHALTHRDLLRLEAHVFDWNPASARVAEKAGFALEARLRQRIEKQGRVGDELIYARLRDAGQRSAGTA